jgi:hypothetical protein
MTMTTTQGEIWKKITQLYYQWDPDGKELMPVTDLSDMLPAVPSELIIETLTRAKENRLAEVDRPGDKGEFRPLQH